MASRCARVGPSRIAAPTSLASIFFRFWRSVIESWWIVWDTSWHRVPASCSLFFTK